YDGPKAVPEKLFYDADASAPTNNVGRQSTMTRQIVIPVFNRQWTISFSTTPAFDSASPRYLQWLTLSGGLSMSFLLFGIVWIQAKARARAERDEAILAIEKEELAVTLFSIGDGVITTDTNANVVSINKAAQILTGWTQKEASGKSL